MKNALLIPCAVCLLALGGCHSAYVEATVHNGTGSAITLLELDYPSASFGKEILAAGQDFHYRFKILGDGGSKVLWTDTIKREHTVAGPQLREGQEGKLYIDLQPDTAKWRFDSKQSFKTRPPDCRTSRSEVRVFRAPLNRTGSARSGGITLPGSLAIAGRVGKQNPADDQDD